MCIRLFYVDPYGWIWGFPLICCVHFVKPVFVIHNPRIILSCTIVYTFQNKFLKASYVEYKQTNKLIEAKWRATLVIHWCLVFQALKSWIVHEEFWLQLNLKRRMKGLNILYMNLKHFIAGSLLFQQVYLKKGPIGPFYFLKKIKSSLLFRHVAFNHFPWGKSL